MDTEKNTDTMKTNILTHTLAAAIAIGIALPAVAATPDARLTSDKPEINVVFHHTPANPYDIRTLSWCGGMAVRVQVVPMTAITFVVAYNTGDLLGAKITGRDPSRIGFVICKAGKTKLLFDMLCLEKRQTLLPNLVTRLSDKSEWRIALALQDRGLLDTKTFAHVPVGHDPRDQYAFSPLPVAAAPQPGLFH